MSRSRDELLNAFLDEALAPPDRAAIEHELASDPALAADLVALRSLDSELRGMNAPVGDDHALARVVEDALRPIPRPVSPWPLVLATALGVAAGLLARVDLDAPDATPESRVVIAPPWTNDPAAIGRVDYVVGAPLCLFPSSKDGSDLAVGATVAADTVVLSGESDRAIVVLRDGGRLWLDAETTVAFDALGIPDPSRGRVVIACPPDRSATLRALGQVFTIDDGACSFAFESFQGKIAKKIPTPILRVTVIRGELTVGERRFGAGSSFAIDDGVIVEGFPPVDSTWFVELTTRAEAKDR